LTVYDKSPRVKTAYTFVVVDLSQASVRIVIADDHPLFRDGLRTLLQSDPAFEVVGEAGDAKSAVAIVKEIQPDVLLLDLAMPGASGLETLRLLLGEQVPTRSIVLTAGIGRMETVQAVQLGARGVVLKAEASNLLFESIRAVSAGHYWLGSQQLRDQGGALRKALNEPRPAVAFDLSPREREVITALGDGLTNRDMADRFGVSEVTIKHHLKNIFDKCGVSNRLELTLFALRHGLARL
jgi:two-component system, NarL family, nitrate/nitrite response regulator NarL